MDILQIFILALMKLDFIVKVLTVNLNLPLNFANFTEFSGFYYIYYIDPVLEASYNEPN